jgi:hypothetical protein
MGHSSFKKGKMSDFERDIGYDSTLKSNLKTSSSVLAYPGSFEIHNPKSKESIKIIYGTPV